MRTNFDGAVFEDLDAAGIDVVVRNSRGEIMEVLTEIVPMPSSIVVLETLAARQAVYFVQELDFRGSIFEGDSEISISAIKNQTFHHPSYGHLIRDIMSSASSFHNFSFSHI